MLLILWKKPEDSFEVLLAPTIYLFTCVCDTSGKAYVLANAGDVRDAGLSLELGRVPGEGRGNPLQYSCLENPIDRGAWQATVHRVAESDGTEAT